MMVYELDDEEQAALAGRPFPQEPAFNSPEAVEQAARVLRFEIEPGFILEASGEVAAFASGRAGLYQQAPDLLAEVERLRKELDARARGGEAIQSELAACDRAELLAILTITREDRAAAHARREQAERQRDALADLLAEIWETVPAEHVGPTVERHAAALNEIPEALRKAGRL